jgi:hypothetical protein
MKKDSKRTIWLKKRVFNGESEREIQRANGKWGQMTMTDFGWYTE